MFSLDKKDNNSNVKSAFDKLKQKRNIEIEPATKVNIDEFGFNIKEEIKRFDIPKIEQKEEVKAKPLYLKPLLDSNLSYSRDQLSQILTLDKFHSILSLSKDVNSFIKLFSLKVDYRLKELIELTIPARELVVQLNKLPEFMQRSDNAMTEVKCQTTEIPMSDLLRQLNKNYKCKLQTPAINTLTPEKDKPDFIIENNGIKILFDMKGQVSGKTININKIAHDRAVEQGLSYYMIGVLDSSIGYDKDTKKLLNYDYVTYYLLPLNYFLNNAKFNKGLSNNSKNDYYSINLKEVVNLDKIM